MRDNKKEVEDVFKTSGMPTYTFVKPIQFTELLVALRTPGRGIVVEGPSGIGKTVGIKKVIEELKITGYQILSARKAEEVEKIKELSEKKTQIGIIIVDDFHILEESIKKKLADLMKVLADNEEKNSKLIIVGINKAG
ncbi:MAG: ATP-binding protein, partial [Nanoarchaeota archaeon]